MNDEGQDGDELGTSRRAEPEGNSEASEMRRTSWWMKGPPRKVSARSSGSHQENTESASVYLEALRKIKSVGMRDISLKCFRS